MKFAKYTKKKNAFQLTEKYRFFTKHSKTEQDPLIFSMSYDSATVHFIYVISIFILRNILRVFQWYNQIWYGII